MRATSLMRFAALLAAAACTAAFVPSASAQNSRTSTTDSATSGGAAGGYQFRARVTGRLIPAKSLTLPATVPAVSGLPSRQQQIQVLTTVLNNMQDNYAQFADITPGPQDILDYGIGPLWKQGIDGAGTTIAVMEGWDDPNIAQVVAGYDQLFGLPDPQITTIFPAGPLPAQCPPGMVALGSYGSCNAWQGELELDVIAAHLIAPYANILISATPADTQENDDPASQVAMPELMKGVEAIAAGHLANVISISDGNGESSYSAGAKQITAQDPAELAAAAAGIPVLVATGDCGVVQNLPVANSQCSNASGQPDTAAWDDSPWVTAVGGTIPSIDPATGAKLGPDPLWHEGIFSEGAGYSSVFSRPAYQNGVASFTGSPMRSVPDIALDAQSGTSEAAPLLNGILALATQLNGGRNVGPINPALYQNLGPRGAAAGIADVVQGNNSATSSGGQTVVQGFTAAPGFDVASGWGTVNGSFAPALATATRADDQEAQAREQASQALATLEHGIRFTPSTTTASGMTYLVAGGFLPGHPVQLSIDGAPAATLTAGDLGTVTSMIAPALMNLSPGQHTVQLSSLLLTMTGTFGIT